MEKKVLYTASTLGHLYAFHLPYLRWLKGEGYTVHAAARGDGGRLPEADRFFDLPLVKSLAAPQNFLAALRLARLIRRERYTLVSAHTSLAAFVTRLAVMLAGKKETRVVLIVHGYLIDEHTPGAKRALLLAAEKLTAGATDLILTMNRQDTEIARRYRLCRGKIERIDGMGVDFARFRPAGAEEKTAARRALGLPAEAFVLVYAAEFSALKNQIMLLKALARLPERVRLLLPGRGDLLDRCREVAETLGVAGRVLFPGFVDDIERYYHAADVCVSASGKEGLPFNVIEAMRCGLPAVASAVKGHEDLVEQGINGYLYPWDDGRQFCVYIDRLLNDAELTGKLGRAAAVSVEKYGLPHAFSQITEAIREAAHG